MKIAVLGAGISGNLIARLLCQEHDVAVFEAEAHAGGHTRTLTLDVFGGRHTVDTGFMVFNERTYPNFCRLLRLLDVPAQETDMSFSVRCERSDLEYQGSSLDGLFAQRRNLVRPAFLRMLWDIARFNRESTMLLAEDLGERSLRDALARGRYGSWFLDKYLTPMAAAIWSCPPGKLLDFPAHFLLGFLRNHGLLQISDRPQWRTILGGARRYVDRLTAPFRDRLYTGSPVETVWRHEDHVVVRSRRGVELFDCIVLACHADQALNILGDADATERGMLQAFAYQRNLALVHTDVSLLPRRRRAWASWNYQIPAEEGRPVMVTYDLSRLQRLHTPSPILLTLNPGTREPTGVLDSYVFRHPRYTAGSLRAQRELRRINGQRRTFFCGAYSGYGFHEDGVNSALAVARHFGLGLDQWKAAFTKAMYSTSV